MNALIMIKRNLNAAGVFVLVTLIGWGLLTLSDNSCHAILGYYDLGGVFTGLTRMIGFFLIGIIVFVLARRFLKIHIARYKVLYFAILPFFVFYHEFAQIPENIRNREVISSICTKSSFNGMENRSANLSLKEYNFIKERTSLLPALPASSVLIDIYYYHDDFLGDYSINIKLICNKSERMILNKDHWFIKPLSGATTHVAVSYESNNANQ